VGERGDAVSLAAFIADQRTTYQVPHTLSCGLLGLSVSWYYKWIKRQPTERQQQRAELDAAVRDRFKASGGTYGSPRVHADLVAAGWRVSVNTVAESMRRQGLAGRKSKRSKGLTKQDRAAPKYVLEWSLVCPVQPLPRRLADLVVRFQRAGGLSLNSPTGRRESCGVW
jgi:transposase InsO family protein